MRRLQRVAELLDRLAHVAVEAARAFADGRAVVEAAVGGEASLPPVEELARARRVGDGDEPGVVSSCLEQVQFARDATRARERRDGVRRQHARVGVHLREERGQLAEDEDVRVEKNRVAKSAVEQVRGC